VEFERLAYNNLSLDEEILLAAGDGPESAGWLFSIEGDTWEKIDSLYSASQWRAIVYSVCCAHARIQNPGPPGNCSCTMS
jgi:hypothetical protein